MTLPSPACNLLHVPAFRFAAVMLMVLAHAPAGADDGGGRVVRYSNDALTVRLSHASVTEVLQEIARQTGAEIRGQAMDSREVSAEFDAVPLPEALDRILGTQNFTLVYGEGGNLKAVKLLGEAQVLLVPRAAVTPVSSDMYAHEIMASYLARPVTLAPGSRLRLVLASSSATVRQVVDVGLRNRDAAVRAEAVRAALQVAEADPQLREALGESIAGLDDVTLSGIVRQAAGEHAEEVVLLFASETTILPLRAKAKALLWSIRAGG